MKNKSLKITREEALNAVPIKIPAIAKEKKHNKLMITLEFERPKWQQILGSDKKCRKTFALDNLGREVYELCNGKNTVLKIIKIISKNYQISIAEAEISVTTFIKTLMSKGLIAIQIKKETQNK